MSNKYPVSWILCNGLDVWYGKSGSIHQQCQNRSPNKHRLSHLSAMCTFVRPDVFSKSLESLIVMPHIHLKNIIQFQFLGFL